MNPKDTSSPRPTARSVRRALAVAVASATAMLGPLPQLAHADGTSEVAIAPVVQAGPLGARIVGDDADGYLLRSAYTSTGTLADEYGYTWTSADGTVTRDLGLLESEPVVLPQPGGGTLLAVTEFGVGIEPVEIGIYDTADGTWLRNAASVPGGQRVVAAVTTATGWAVVTQEYAAGQAGPLHLLRPAADGWTDTVVGGQSADSVMTPRHWRSTGGDLALIGSSPSGARMDLVDLDTAALVYSGAWTWGASTGLVLNGHSFGSYDSAASRLTLRSIDAPQTAAADMTVTPPAGATDPVLTDSALILGVPGAGVRTGERPGSVESFPLDGSAATMLSTSAGPPVATADGGAVYDAATGSGDWATYKAPSGGGAVSVVRELPAYRPRPIGLSLDRGRLTRVESGPGYEMQEYLESADLGAGAVPAPPGPVDALPLTSATAVVPRCDGTPCQPLTGTDAAPDDQPGGSPDYVSTGRSGTSELVQVNGAMKWWVGTSGGRIVAAEGAEVVYDDGSGKQYLGDFSNVQGFVTRPAVAAALWGGALWSATSTPGTFAVGRPGSATASVTTDVPCVPDEIQVLGHWLYWSCGDAGPAGVYDTTSRTSVRVPAGKALLGDGFVLRHAGGSLVLTDVRTGAAADRTLADLPAGPYTDDRGITWTVDRHSGLVAYSDPDGTTHVLASGVPASPLEVLRSTVPAQASSQGIGWRAQWTASRPVASWRVDVRRRGHSTVVASFGGGAARSTLSGSWNGKDASGLPVLYGAYTWTLNAAPVGATDSEPVASGTVIMAGGRSLDRDYSGDHVGDLFGLTSGGRLDLRPGTGAAPGGIRATASSGSGWPTSALLIPYGDLNGDDVNDLLVRDSSGRLTAYYGSSGHAFTPSGPHKAIGWGWNIYDVLTSPGDITGDVRPDLIARDAHGDLYLYAATSAGTLAPRRKVGHGYQMYDTIVGAPYILGFADYVQSGNLLARDRSGGLWAYLTDGTGWVGAPTRLGWGWNIYNAIVGVGDVNGDGSNDVVARDAAGVLWFYAGRGAGLAPRVRIGWGWQAYRSLL